MDPTTLRGGDSQALLTVPGENLNDVKQVPLEHGDDHIKGTDVMSNATKVTAKVTIDAKAPPGPWDVVVMTDQGAARH